MLQESQSIPAEVIRGLEVERRKNLRQLLLHASRVVNGEVVEGLHAKGYTKLRSTHTTLLSNLPLAGASVTQVAERAGITKQAMGRLASELEMAGYLKQEQYAVDGRVRMLSLTTTGTRLMLDSLDVMATIQNRYAAAMGKNKMQAMMRGLAALAKLGRASVAGKTSIAPR
jgi:DNA-binding MarR family transcriptional regulator